MTSDGHSYCGESLLLVVVIVVAVVVAAFIAADNCCYSNPADIEISAIHEKHYYLT